VGETKKIGKKIAGHQRSIREHQEKIDRELKSPNPDWILIQTWEKHKENAQRQIEKLEQRLERRKRRG
jgi:hypothetical protein